MGRASRRTLIVELVLHHRFPRSVDDSLRSIDGLTLIEPSDDAESLRALERADAFATFVWDDQFLVPGLRWVQAISTGYDQFPVDAFADRGVVLTTARGVHGPQVADHAFALLLAMTRGIGISMRHATEKRWQPHMNYEVAGATMGILGLGSVGEEIGRRATSWGMTVVGTKRDPSGYEGCAARVFGPDGTDEVFDAADIVVNVLPSLPETVGLIDRDLLARLSDGWFVNVGRGTIVSEADLLWALDDGGLRGAGLDVTDPEPLPESSPLWDHPKVVITPHTGGLSPMYGPRLAPIVEANARAHATGEGWVNRVV